MALTNEQIMFTLRDLGSRIATLEDGLEQGGSILEGQVLPTIDARVSAITDQVTTLSETQRELGTQVNSTVNAMATQKDVQNAFDAGKADMLVTTNQLASQAQQNEAVIAQRQLWTAATDDRLQV